jgi:hypothetical protein
MSALMSRVRVERLPATSTVLAFAKLRSSLLVELLSYIND